MTMHYLTQQALMSQWRRVADLTKYMTLTPPMSAEEVYEAVLGNNEEMLYAFRMAGKYFPAAKLHNEWRVVFVTPEQDIRVRLNLPPSALYHCWWLPRGSTPLASDSKLRPLLLQQQELLDTCETIEHVLGIFTTKASPSVVSFLMPFTRLMATDYLSGHRSPSRFPRRGDKVAIKELNQMLQRPTPRSYPSLTRDVHELIKQASQLWSQYMMATATSRPPPEAFIIADEGKVSKDIKAQVEDIMTEWKCDNPEKI